jgi:hypothetical protein
MHLCIHFFCVYLCTLTDWFLPTQLKQDWKEATEGGEKEFGKGKRERKSTIVMTQGTGSGYGKTLVPVLALNNYSLETGEQSCWRETKAGGKDRAGAVVPKKKKGGKKFVNQKMCQFCGDGGTILLLALTV